MTTPYDIEQAVRQLTVARYLLTRADNRGYTHGEKHHIIKVVLWLLMDATAKLEGGGGNHSMRNEVEDLNPSDIPF